MKKHIEEEEKQIPCSSCNQLINIEKAVIIDDIAMCNTCLRQQTKEEPMKLEEKINPKKRPWIEEIIEKE